MTYFWKPARGVPSQGDYRFGHISREYRHGAWTGAKTLAQRLIEIIATAKHRRLLRELELRGIKYDQSTNSWINHSGHSRLRSK
jgi:hypothetical protein